MTTKWIVQTQYLVKKTPYANAICFPNFFLDGQISIFGRPNFFWTSKLFWTPKKIWTSKKKIGRPKTEIWTSKKNLDVQKNLAVQKKNWPSKNNSYNFLIDIFTYPLPSRFMYFYQKRVISKSLHSSYPKCINPRIKQRNPIVGEQYNPLQYCYHIQNYLLSGGDKN